jgi:hypothetical protein
VRIIGPTPAGRLLTIALESTDDPVVWRPVTGWPSTDDPVVWRPVTGWPSTDEEMAYHSDETGWM